MSEYSNRRDKLLELVPEGSLLVIHSGVSKIASEDENYDFVVNNNFFYLTGIRQENSCLMLVKNLGLTKTYLFIDEFDELKEKWTGKRLTMEEASMISDIKNVLTNNVLESKIELALQEGSTHFGIIKKMYLDLTPELKIADCMSTQDYKLLIEANFPHIQVYDMHFLCGSLRMVKSQYEIERIKEAINLTQRGINRCLMNLKPQMYEYQLANIFEFYGKDHDKSGLAFPSIVASGKNATILHYPQQMDRIKEGDLVLFDVGYNYKDYNGDISRTFPISGRFNDIQKLIYSLVLLCNKSIISYIKPGLTIADLQAHAMEFYKRELPKAGLLGPNEDVRDFYFHSCSHHLGLDTHDLSDRNTPLEPGNVITVEPGLYMKKYGVGVRIEDDVLITNDGCEVLSRGIPKEVEDVEQLVQSCRKIY